MIRFSLYVPGCTRIRSPELAWSIASWIGLSPMRPKAAPLSLTGLPLASLTPVGVTTQGRVPPIVTVMASIDCLPLSERVIRSSPQRAEAFAPV